MITSGVIAVSAELDNCIGVDYQVWKQNESCKLCVTTIITIGMNDQASFEACGGTISPTPSTDCADIDYNVWSGAIQNTGVSLYVDCDSCVANNCDDRCVQTVIFEQQCGGHISQDLCHGMDHAQCIQTLISFLLENWLNVIFG